MNEQNTRIYEFCPILALAHSMPGGPKSPLCGSNCAFYSVHGCAIANAADSLERIADALDCIADRKEDK